MVAFCSRVGPGGSGYSVTGVVILSLERECGVRARFGRLGDERLDAVLMVVDGLGDGAAWLLLPCPLAVLRVISTGVEGVDCQCPRDSTALCKINVLAGTSM